MRAHLALHLQVLHHILLPGLRRARVEDDHTAQQHPRLHRHNQDKHIIEPRNRTHVECCVVHVEEGHLGLVLPADEDVGIRPDVAPVEEPGQAQAYEARAPTQWDVRPKYVG